MVGWNVVRGCGRVECGRVEWEGGFRSRRENKLGK